MSDSQIATAMLMCSYGLSWSTVKEGHIISCGDDAEIAHWDITEYSKKDPSMQPLRTYSGHSGTIGVRP